MQLQLSFYCNFVFTLIYSSWLPLDANAIPFTLRQTSRKFSFLRVDEYYVHEWMKLTFGDKIAVELKVRVNLSWFFYVVFVSFTGIVFKVEIISFMCHFFMNLRILNVLFLQDKFFLKFCSWFLQQINIRFMIIKK